MQREAVEAIRSNFPSNAPLDDLCAFLADMGVGQFNAIFAIAEATTWSHPEAKRAVLLGSAWDPSPATGGSSD
jgi:hypothetical protein